MSQLKTTDIKMDDELKALLLLNSFSNNWVVLVVTLTDFAPNRKLVMSTVSDK